MVKYAPVSCKYKVYIIDEVHMLTGGAFNALLKTIEELDAASISIISTLSAASALHASHLPQGLPFCGVTACGY